MNVFYSIGDIVRTVLFASLLIGAVFIYSKLIPKDILWILF